MTNPRRSTREFVVMEAAGLVALGIPRDLSEELVPCVARGKFNEVGKPITLHLTHIGQNVEDPDVASVVYAPTGSFLRLVLQRSKESRHFE